MKIVRLHKRMVLTTLSIFIFFLISGVSCPKKCGTERWDVKTLSDNDTTRIEFNRVVPTTVNEQASLPAPEGRQTVRLKSETTVYSMNCYLMGYKKEKDNDIHLVVADLETGETMVAEIPSPDCQSVQKTSRYNSFIDLNNWFVQNIGNPTSKFKHFNKPIPVMITGVGFFDFLHGQTGMAVNGREIHPVLSMKIR